MNRKILAAVAGVIVVAAVGGYAFLGKEAAPTYRTMKIDRGSVVSSISATGTLNAVVTVQVGTQVSGTIQRLFVDFNSPVKKGQEIAQIDPSLLSAQREQSRGNHLAAQANLARAKVTLADAKRTLERNRQLLKEGIISQGDFDAAETAAEAAAAGVRSAEGALAQAGGALSQAETNLRYTTIRSPVDGIVVSRSVDVGQTVAASFQTPTLFTIAKDLTKMEIQASVDEADIGRTKLGQPVTFTVDAYPEQQFKGVVSQIRNAPVVAQNVVTYVTVIQVDNRDLRLKPGMTANVSIETARKDDVLRVPAAALRFRPKGGKESGKDGSTAKARPDAQDKGSAGGEGKKPREKGQKIYILSAEKKPAPVEVKTGIANDTHVELVEGSLKENDEVVVEQVSTQKKGSAAKSGMGGGAPKGMMGPRF